MSNPEQAHHVGVMEYIRNSRPVQALAEIAMGTAALAGNVTLARMALDAEPVAADNVPAANAAKFVIGKCKSTDSKKPNPQWHSNYGFETLEGRPTQSVHPGETVKFAYHVAGGNVDSFSLEANTEAPMYHFPKDMDILEQGSHPTWSHAGGNPHWVLKDLCHWSTKKTISFLVAVDKQAEKHRQLCMPFNVSARTGSNEVPYDPPVRRECLTVR